MAREHDRIPVAMSGKLRTPYGRQDVTLSDLSLTGCRINAVFMTLSVGQRIVLRPEGLEGLNAVVSWTSGPSAGIHFDVPLAPYVLDFLVKAHPDESRPIAVEVGDKPPSSP
jgi:hypothetical protein